MALVAVFVFLVLAVETQAAKINVKESKMTLVGFPELNTTVKNLNECIKKENTVPWVIQKMVEDNATAAKSYFLMPENANACSKTDLENCQAIIAAFKCPEGFERQVSDSKNVHNCLGIVPYGEDCPGHSFLAILRDETLNSFAEQLIGKDSDNFFKIGLKKADRFHLIAGIWSWIDGSAENIDKNKFINGVDWSDAEVYIDKNAGKLFS
ncbi:hypothetical protein L596_022598 [Steinernema carpocapsae]|uniref:C-type lectin domain-containing protein n=1 Tax=Steinernema carpocapsae TaxID=34508 RepID=A0A4U5MN21_STECR|nr:hypothetical protein L596_022598 [Steinernema carpocapsae]